MFLENINGPEDIKKVKGRRFKNFSRRNKNCFN